MDKDLKQSLQIANDAKCNAQKSESSKTDGVIHDEELGQENVELVDSEWADFERALRYDIDKFTESMETKSAL